MHDDTKEPPRNEIYTPLYVHAFSGAGPPRCRARW